MDILKNKNFTIIAISGLAYILTRIFLSVPFDTESIIYYSGATLLVAFIISQMKLGLNQLALAAGGVSAIYLLVQVYLFNLPFESMQLLSVLEQGLIGYLVAYVSGVRK